MAYGLQLFNELGQEVVGLSRNVFVMDKIYVDGASGSRTYEVGPGEKIHAFVIPDFTQRSGPFWGVVGLSVSGGTVSYSAIGRANNPGYLLIVKSGVA